MLCQRRCTRGSVSVDTNLHGEFVFTGRPPGRYHLGVGLRRGPRPAQAFPATYFPGTTDRREAVPVTVELGRPAEGFDFFLPPALPRGVLAVTITGGGAGEASICLTPLERQSTRSTQLAPRDRPADVAVVSGLRYEIHAHLRSRDGRHLESKRRTFTARMGRVPMTLTLDAPLELHP